MHREEIKWAPFSAVMNGQEAKHQIAEQKNRISKPILTDEQLWQLEQTLMESFHEQCLTIIRYYSHYHLHEVQGIILKIDAINKLITLSSGHKIYFFDIVNISKKSIEI